MRLYGEPIEERARARPMARRRGTTLIELLVVISLIGILIAFLVPSLKRSMGLARATVCMHNLREIGHALALYRVENEGWLPSNEEAPEGSGVVGGPKPWFGALLPTYLQDPLILTCPEDPHRYRMLKVEGPAYDSRVAEYSSYGINGFLMAARDGELAQLDRHRPTRPLDTILLGDLGPDRGYTVTRVGRSTGPARTGVMPWDDGYDPFRDRQTQPWLTTRHGKGINILTAADLVRSANTKIVMEKRIDRYYENCASGGCTFCNDLRLDHYSFAKDRLFWWTGPTPVD